jgi:hypothetical protein
VISKATSKDESPYTETPIRDSVSASVVRKEIFRDMDNLGLGWHLWYNLNRYKFQLSVIINIAVIGLPIFRFIHQFFV